MSNPFIPQLANKAAPVGSDILIIADSQNSNNEKNTTFTQVITNLDIVTEPSAITAGHIPVSSNTNTIVDSGLIVDHSQNLTNVGTINGITLSQLLVDSNNLNDVSNKTSSFNNISPLSVKGDLLGFGTTNTRLPIGTNTFVLTADSTQTLGFSWEPIPAGGGGFADNAIFGGIAGTTINISFTTLDVRQTIQFSPGNTWTVNSFTNLTCNQAGTYIFSGSFTVASNGTSNYCFGRFAKNGSPTGVSGQVQLQNAGVSTITITGAIFTCVPGDVITLVAYSNGGYSVPSTATTGGTTSTQVSIIRLQ